MSFKLNIINNISVGVDTSSITNIHNIGVGIGSSNNNSLDGNDLDEYFKKNKEDKDNKADFNLHDTPIDYLF